MNRAWTRQLQTWALCGSALAGGVLFAGCQDQGGPATTATAPVRLARVKLLSSAPPSGRHRSAVLAPDPATVRVSVSGADFGVVTQTVPAGTSSVELVAPQGRQRTVQIAYIASNGEILGTGSATVDLNADVVTVSITVTPGVPGTSILSTDTPAHNALVNQPFTVTSTFADNTNSAVTVNVAGHRYRVAGTLADMSGGFMETLASPTAPFALSAGQSVSYATSVKTGVAVAEGLYQIDGVVEGSSASAGAFGVRTSVLPAMLRLIHEHVTANLTGAKAAGFSAPTGVAPLSTGDVLVGDTGNQRIRVLFQNGSTQSLCGGPGGGGVSPDNTPANNANISGPMGVAQLSAGDIVFAESGNNKIRRFRPGATLQTFAGSGVAGYAGDGQLANSASVQLQAPEDVIVQRGAGGDVAYIADTQNHAVRIVDAGGIIGTVAGRGPAFPGLSGDGGPPQAASLLRPRALAIDLQGNLLIAHDFDDGTGQPRGVIRKVDFAANTISTLVGSTNTAPLNGGFDPEGQQATATRLGQIRGLAVDASGLIYLCEQGGARNTGRILQLDPEGFLRTVAGGPTATQAGAGRPATDFFLDKPARMFFDGTRFVFAHSTGNAIEALQ